MQNYDFPLSGTPNVLLLLEQLYAAYPRLKEWGRPTPMPEGNAVWVTGDGSPGSFVMHVCDDLTVEEIASIQSIIVAHDPALPSARERLRSGVLTTAQSAVGVQIKDLTAAQVKALLAVLLYVHGAIGDDLRVRPLRDWAS